jgi:excisionase family DNA binding protein
MCIPSPFLQRFGDDIPSPGQPAPGVVPIAEAGVYTVKEVRQILGLSLGGTYAAIRSGEIPAHKLGGRWVIPKRRFVDWLDSCEQRPAGRARPSA